METQIRELEPWYHKVTLPDGSVTPGKIDTARKFDIFSECLPKDLSGTSVLDLGCSSGGLSLAYALRGAEVTGIDSKCREVEQARFLFDSCGLAGSFHQDDVMNAWRYGRFDIVNACGLLYHLPYPVLFLDQLSYVCKNQLILATRISPEEGELMNLERNASHGNWWFPTEDCVLNLLTIAGFEGTRVISVNGDRSNMFCTATTGTNNWELHDSENLLELLIAKRSPSGERIVGSSERNDLPKP